MAYTYEKQLWKDYPDTTTPITSDRLNHMEDGIKGLSDAQVSIEVVDSLDGNSTTNPPSVRAVNEGLLDKYSTEEQVIGTWIDGKPLYRKTIFVSSLPNNEDAREYSHNIKNMNMGWFDPTGCFAIWPTGVTNTFSYINYTGASLFLHDVTKDSFKIKTTQDRSGLSAYVTILYTKTTD